MHSITLATFKDWWTNGIKGTSIIIHNLFAAAKPFLNLNDSQI